MQTNPQGVNLAHAAAEFVNRMLNPYPIYDPLRRIVREAEQQKMFRRIRRNETFSKDPELCRYFCPTERMANAVDLSGEEITVGPAVYCSACKTRLALLGVVEK